MKIGVVIDLNEWFKWDIQPLRIVQHRMVIVGNTPWPRIDVKATVELAPLRGAAEFGVFVSAANGPGTPTCAVVVFQNLDRVARVSQFVRGYKAGHPGAENQYFCALGRTIQFDPAAIRRRRRKPQRVHRLVHGGSTSSSAYQRQQLAAA